MLGNPLWSDVPKHVTFGLFRLKKVAFTKINKSKNKNLFAVEKGMRIAQLICEKIYLPQIEECEVRIVLVIFHCNK